MFLPVSPTKKLRIGFNGLKFSFTSQIWVGGVNEILQMSN